MKILNLLGADFERGCIELGREIERTDFTPEVILGVATGGWVVADTMKKLGLFESAHYCSIRCRRSTSGVKDKPIVQRIIRSLPDWVANILRHTEAAFARSAALTTREIEISEESKALLRAHSKILIVDDAVDSGSTMKSVIDYVIQNAADGTDVKAAAIVLTNSRAKYKPDIALYSDVLIRFPWAADAAVAK